MNEDITMNSLKMKIVKNEWMNWNDYVLKIFNSVSRDSDYILKGTYVCACVIKRIGFRPCVWPRHHWKQLYNKCKTIDTFTATYKLSYYNFEYTDCIQVNSSCSVHVQKTTYKSNLQKTYNNPNKLATIETIMKIQLPR